MDFIRLTRDKLSLDDAMEQVAAANCGAVSFFVGTTRDNFDNKKVVSLEYEAYDGMAEKVIKNICNEIRDKWKDVENIAVYHRLGIVPVKESSVVIAISSPHRQDSLEATQYCINTLKQSVPIWKKEIYDQSEPIWKENSECPWTNDVKNKRNKKTKFVFNPRVESSNITSHLVQITCSSDEINRRINTFINRKREQVNQSNVRDFCGDAFGDTCARIDSKLIRAKNTKSHLRSQRVYNDLGAYNTTKLQQLQSKTDFAFVSEAITKRIEYIEDNLDIVKPVSPDIYERLKKIEDRILFLETLSPEYAHFWNKDSMFLRENGDENEMSHTSNTKKQKFSVEYVDNLLYELEKQSYKTSV